MAEDWLTKVRRRNKKILRMDKEKLDDGFRFKVLWKDGHYSYERIEPKESQVYQIFDLLTLIK